MRQFIPGVCEGFRLTNVVMSLGRCFAANGRSTRAVQGHEKEGGRKGKKREEGRKRKRKERLRSSSPLR